MLKAYPASLHVVHSLLHTKHSHADDNGSHDTPEAVAWEKTPANHLAILTCADACTFPILQHTTGHKVHTVA